MNKVVQIGGNLRINGISSFIMSVYRELHDEYQFIFINTANESGYYSNEILRLGGKIYTVNVKGKGLVRSLRQSKAIRTIIQEEKPIAVHSHYYSNNGIYLYQAYKEKVQVRISHCHQSNPKYISFSKRIAKTISRLFVEKYATHKLGCSKEACKFLYNERGVVFHNPIDYSKYMPFDVTEELYDKYKLSSKYAYISHVGRMTTQKNPFFLIEIMKKLSIVREDIRLLVVSHGPLKELFIDRIEKSHLEGWITILEEDCNVNEINNISRCFILPSLYEGFPISLIEDQAAGLVCLVSENVSPEVNLGLCEFLPLNVDEWVNRIIEITQEKNNRPPLRDERFDVKTTLSKLRKIYSK